MISQLLQPDEPKSTAPFSPGILLAGDPVAINRELAQPALQTVIRHTLLILMGAGSFGAAVGSWRDPIQSLYTAIKLPFILLCCAMGNALLNGLLSAHLGSKLSLRNSFLSILISFSLAAMILGSVGPLLAFYVWNMPPSASGSVSTTAYSGLMVLTVAAIAFAGVAANIRLLVSLEAIHDSRRLARRLVVGWLSGNLLLGTQLSWMLRPFFGSPALEVQFLRPDAFHGNFFQAVWFAFARLINN